MKALLALIFTGLSLGCAAQPIGIYDISEPETVAYRTYGDGTEMLMDIVKPHTNFRRRPAVLWFHGGAFIAGSRTEVSETMNFLSSMGYVTASADYRLVSDGFVFTDAMSDAKHAFSYLVDNAAKYGIDPDRIVVAGDSAGAHLALMVGLQEPGVKAIINAYGSTDLLSLYDVAEQWLKDTLVMLIGSTPKEDPAAWKNASPSSFLSEKSPPILTLHGDRDQVIPVSQAMLLADLADERAADVTTGIVDKAGHGWVRRRPFGRAAMQTFPLMTHFLREHTVVEE